MKKNKFYFIDSNDKIINEKIKTLFNNLNSNILLTKRDSELVMIYINIINDIYERSYDEDE